MAYLRWRLLKRIKSYLRPSKRTKMHSMSASVASTSSSSSSAKYVATMAGEDELENVFRIYDANGDGLITWQELGEGLRKLGQCGDVEEEVLKLIVKEADANGDGFIDFAEFVEMNRRNASEEERVEDLKNAFDIFDVDGNGQISADELQRVLKSMGEKCTLEECGRMIEGADCNGDGVVNFEEFLVLMGPRPRPRPQLPEAP